MKLVMTLVSCFGALVLSSAAMADSKVVYGNENSNVVIKGSVVFPGYGEVRSDKVCVVSDKQTLKVAVPASVENVCVRSYVDHSDSAYPVTRCEKYETVRQPARTLETPVTTSKAGCVRSHVDHTDSTRPQTICDQMGTVLVSQSLTYEVETFEIGDYRHENSPKVEIKSIAICE